MDLKLKGTLWAGRFCQKFEKEAVKYFENQVQTVGQNMKKLYSDVISDRLHPSMDPVEHVVQEKSLERNSDIYCLLESEINIDESHEDKVDEQSHVEPSEFDPLKKERDPVLNWIHLLKQMNSLPNMGPFEGADSDQAPRQTVAASKNSNPNLKYEALIENSSFYEASELNSLGKEDYFGDSLQILQVTQSVSLILLAPLSPLKRQVR